LRRFTRSRDEAAFAELVARHGTLVLGVARRVLGEHHAAEDVLQATFLLLARKAKRVRWRCSVAPWLQAAAYHLACKARRRELRRPAPLTIDAAGGDSPEQSLLWQEVRSVIDEELSRLSAPLRAPLVLCYLQGLTRDEAALQLGWTLATLKRRLKRGRNLLRLRLTRRRLALGAAAGLLAAAELPSAEMVCEVVRLAAGGEVPKAVAALLGDQRSWRRVGALALLLAAGVGGAALAMWPGKPSDPPTPAKPPATQRVDALGDQLPDGALARLGTRRLRPGQMIQGVAWSPDGKRLAIWSHAVLMFGRDQLIIVDSATGRELRVVDLPKCTLLRLRWLADGRGLALVKYDDGGHVVWEFTDEKSTVPEGTGRGDGKRCTPRAVDFSPDGRWMTIGGFNFAGFPPTPLLLVEVTPNAALAKMAVHELQKSDSHGMGVAFSADSKYLFALTQRQEMAKGIGAGGLPPSADSGKRAEKARLQVYEVPGGTLLKEFDVPPTMDYNATGKPALECLAAGSDGKTVYLGDEKGYVHAYDWAAGRKTLSYLAHPASDGEAAGVTGLALAPDGRTLLTCGFAGGVYSWDLATDPPARQLQVKADRPDILALAPDRQRIAFGSTRYIASQVRVLDARTGADVLSLPGHASFVTGVALRGGELVTSGLGEAVRWWDPETGRELRRRDVNVIQNWHTGPTFVDGGRSVLGHDKGELFRVDIESGQRTPIPAEKERNYTLVIGVASSTAFINMPGEKIRQWDVLAVKPLQAFELPPVEGARQVRAQHATASPDGRQVVILSTAYFAGRTAGQISFHDTATGEPRRRWMSNETRFDCAAYSEDGQWLLAGGLSLRGQLAGATADDPLPLKEGTGLVLFDAKSGEPVRTFEQVAKSSDGYRHVSTLTFSPDTRFFAVSQIDGSIVVYEFATGQVCRSFRGHRNAVSQLLFIANGRRLVSVSHDMTGLVWDSSLANLAKPRELTSEEQRRKAWSDLATPEWEIAGSAIAALAQRPDDLLTFVRDRLKPADKPDVDAEAVAKLVAQLDDPLFAVRERAAAALGRQGREVLPLLQEHLAKAATAEGRKRLQQIIRAVAQGAVPSDRLREMRVVALLEQARTDAARAELKRLASGHADAGLTRDADAALRRKSP
jgi:RNA polymerase sigma factor (sigma-70 family)